MFLLHRWATNPPLAPDTYNEVLASQSSLYCDEPGTTTVIYFKVYGESVISDEVVGETVADFHTSLVPQPVSVLINGHYEEEIKNLYSENTGDSLYMHGSMKVPADVSGYKPKVPIPVSSWVGTIEKQT